jgi:formimidoylglutamate deiminase
MTSRTFRCQALLTRDGWLEPAFVTVDANGTVTSVSATAPAGTQAIPLDGLVLPSFVNAHSHAFQYAMAGVAEHMPAAAAKDDFWSWREVMYGMANRITPSALEAVATMLYMEMAAAGYTHVAEFHYLHHDEAGRPFHDQAEFAHRLIAAARQADVALTLLPVFYQRGGFGKAAKATQRRFLSADPMTYRRLVDATRHAARGHADVSVGLAIHSLRAVAPEAIREVYGWNEAVPHHIHVAEQQREVDDCVAHLKQRPVRWLIDDLGIDARTHLVHATHTDQHELGAIVKSGANVVLCPSTEGNLGDGLFALGGYHRAGGTYAIGTDSHIGLSPLEELRWLDYGQRLTSQTRNTLCAPGDDSGHQLFQRVWQGGRAAVGASSAREYFAKGTSFDAIVVDAAHPVIAGKPAASRLAALIYASDPRCYLGVLRHSA